MKFNPNNYETVKERKKRFYNDNPDGRIIVSCVNPDTIETHALFRVSIFKSGEDQEKMNPWATGYAHETRNMKLSISRSGDEYESVNYSAWVENCEESAIGRALDNAGYAGRNKCSREEMKKATRPRQMTDMEKGMSCWSKIKDISRTHMSGLSQAEKTDIMKKLNFEPDKIDAMCDEEIKDLVNVITEAE